MGYSNFSVRFWPAGQMSPDRFWPAGMTKQEWHTLQYMQQEQTQTSQRKKQRKVVKHDSQESNKAPSKHVTQHKIVAIASLDRPTKKQGDVQSMGSVDSQVAPDMAMKWVPEQNMGNELHSRVAAFGQH